MRTALAVTGFMLVSSPLAADYRHVIADQKTDFSGLKTFSIREGRATTTRPELNTRLVLGKVEDAIRAHLSAKGLTESRTSADLVVGFTVGDDRPNGPAVTFDQGVLVIQMTGRDANALVWQGVYTDDKSTPARLAEKLPGHVKKLLSEYPPKKKR